MIRRIGSFHLSMAALVLATSLQAAELNGKVETFVGDFNAQARTLGAQVVLVETDCDDSPSRTCKFETTKGMAGYVQGTDGSANASTVMLLKGQAEASDFVLAVGVMMAMYAEGVSKDERGAALMHMLKKVTEEGVTGKARLSNVSFSLSHQSGVGVMALVEAVE